MKKVIVSILAVAGTAAAANAQGLVDLQVSTDGVNFSNSVNVLPGTQVVVRMYASYTGAAAPAGLASFVAQPTVSNWNDSVLAPFANGGISSNVTFAAGMVPAADADGLDGPWGRLIPWGRTTTGSTNFIRGHVHNAGSGGAPAGSWLRIAQSNVTGWVGGTGNTTGNGGVPISQLSNVGRTASDPAFSEQLTNILTFQFSFVVGANQADGTVMNVTVPADGFGNRATTGVREMYWWTNLSETTGGIRGGITVDGAAVNVVIPSPASLALLSLGGLVAAGRRRR